MDIESREKALLQKNASISATSSPKLESKLPRSVSIQSLSNASPKLESKLPRMVSVESLGSPKLEPKLQRRVSMERNRHPSDSSSISSINTPISIKGNVSLIKDICLQHCIQKSFLRGLIFIEMLKLESF